MCIVVEDSPVGISAAQSAGMVPLHFRHGTALVNGIANFYVCRDLAAMIGELSNREYCARP